MGYIDACIAGYGMRRFQLRIDDLTYVQFSQHIRHNVESRGAGAGIHGVAIDKVLGICKGSTHRKQELG